MRTTAMSEVLCATPRGWSREWTAGAEDEDGSVIVFARKATATRFGSRKRRSSGRSHAQRTTLGRLAIRTGCSGGDVLAERRKPPAPARMAAALAMAKMSTAD